MDYFKHIRLGHHSWSTNTEFTHSQIITYLQIHRFRSFFWILKTKQSDSLKLKTYVLQVYEVHENIFSKIELEEKGIVWKPSMSIFDKCYYRTFYLKLSVQLVYIIIFYKNSSNKETVNKNFDKYSQTYFEISINVNLWNWTWTVLAHLP